MREAMAKETSCSETGRTLMLLHHEELADYEAIVAAMIDYFDGQLLGTLDGSPVGMLVARIRCKSELIEVVWDEAWGITVRMERDNPTLLRLIADFLDGYLPKYRSSTA